MLDVALANKLAFEDSDESVDFDLMGNLGNGFVFAGEIVTVTLELTSRSSLSRSRDDPAFTPDEASTSEPASTATQVLPLGGLLSDESVHGSVSREEEPAVDGAAKASISSIVPIEWCKG